MPTTSRKIIPIYKDSSFRIPVSQLEPEEIEAAHNRFTYRFYDDKKCKPCEYLADRHCDICDSCVAFKGQTQTSKIVEIEGKNFLSLPVGASKKVKQWLRSIDQEENYKIKKRHPELTPFSRPLKVTRKLYDYQSEAVEVLFKKKRGILHSKPRTGKTVMAVALSAKIGLKTLVIASQTEWLDQFYVTYLGSDDKPKFTDAKRRQIKHCKTLEDFEKADVALCTYSKFMSKKSKKLLEKVRHMFNVVITDECFTRDHEVLTDKGFVGIETIVADYKTYKVLSYNHSTLLAEVKPVISSLKKKVKQLVAVTIDGIEYLNTPEHLYWSETRQEYVKAIDLLPGEKVLLGPISNP